MVSFDNYQRTKNVSLFLSFDMNLTLTHTNIFFEQINSLDSKSKELVRSKIELIKLNPFRFKRIKSSRFNRVFRVRFSLRGIETRLIYVILGQKIILVCLFDRDKGYNDLEKMLAKINT